MREPTPDHGQTWEDFYRSRSRRLAELEVALEQFEWWEQEQARQELALLRFELDYAGGKIEG